MLGSSLKNQRWIFLKTYSFLFALIPTAIIREMKPVIKPKMPRPGASAAKPRNAKTNAIAIIIIAMAKPDILLSSF